MEQASARGPRPHFLIADDHVMFAEALCAYLEKTYTVVGIAPDGHTMVKEALSQRPDVIIVDVGMPRLNGLDAARAVKEQDPKIKFVFLTMHDDANLAAAALELGKVAFVLKHSAGSELLKAIEHVLRGKRYVTPILQPKDWFDARAKARRFSKEITPRQEEVVRLLAEGRQVKEIARLLHVSAKTVEFHKREIMLAYSFKNNADLVLFALKRGLITDTQLE